MRVAKRAGLAVVLAVALVLPFVLSNFRLFQFTQVFIYAIALLGLNMLTGYNGQISLGHGAFYALGAYTTAIMIDQWSVPYGWTIPAAGVLCLVAGFLFGIPALRLEGLYLALCTFALALAVPQILKYFEHWTGGSQGSDSQRFIRNDARLSPATEVVNDRARDTGNLSPVARVLAASKMLRRYAGGRLESIQ